MKPHAKECHRPERFAEVPAKECQQPETFGKVHVEESQQLEPFAEVPAEESEPSEPSAKVSTAECQQEPSIEVPIDVCQPLKPKEVATEGCESQPTTIKMWISSPVALSNPVKEGKESVFKEVSSSEVLCTKGKLLVTGKCPTETIDL